MSLLSSLVLHKRHIFLILLFLVITNILVANSLRESYLDVFWLTDSDDTKHTGIAYNFWINDSFTSNYLGKWIAPYSLDEVKEKYPEIQREQSGKGPLYYITLGTFYKIIQPEPSELWSTGSYFNTLLTSVFLILFFLLIYKKFNLPIAFLSSLIITLNPYFEWSGVRPTPMVLMGIFSLALLFFLKKRNLDYFLFGFFSGFAHLTHPFGLFLPLSYSIYLLIKREFKGFLIVTLTWTAILIPWFIRNYYFFKNIGAGLFIPFSYSISNYLSFLPTISTQPLATNFIEKRLETSILSPFVTLIEMYENFTLFYHMDYLLIFVFAFSGFAFFNLVFLKKEKKLKITVSLIYIISIFYIFFLTILYVAPKEIISQYFMVLGLPIILILILYKYKKYIFVKPIPRYNLLITIFAIVSLIAYFYTAFVLNRSLPETRQLMFVIFLAIPIGLVGLQSILTQIIDSISEKIKTRKIDNLSHVLKIKKFNTKHLVLIIMFIMLIPIFDQQLSGINYFSNLESMPQTQDSIELDQFIRNEIPKDAVVMSNFPASTFMQTGLQTVKIHYKMDIIELGDYIDLYDVKYLIFYNVDVYRTLYWDRVIVKNIDNHIIPYATNIIYKDDTSLVYKIEPLTDEYIDQKLKHIDELRHYEPYLRSIIPTLNHFDNEIKNAITTNDMTQVEKSKKYLNNFLDFPVKYLSVYDENMKTDIVNVKGILNSKLFDKFNNLLDLHTETIQKFYAFGHVEKAKNIEVIRNDVVQIYFKENKDFVPINLEQISILLSESKGKEALEKFYDAKEYLEWEEMTSKKYGLDILAKNSYEKKIDLLTKSAEIFMNVERFNVALSIYNELLNENDFDYNIWLQLGIINEKRGDHSASIHHYTMALRLSGDDSIMNRINNLDTNLDSLLPVEQFVKILDNNYNALEKIHILNPLNTISYNEVDSSVWQKLGILYEQNNEFSLAISAYENIMKIEPENNVMAERIDRLRNFIEN